MLGFRRLFASMTHGEGLLQRAFLKYDLHRHVHARSMPALCSGVAIAGHMQGDCAVRGWY
jgi:predicted membrane GTPase involved in stress response